MGKGGGSQPTTTQTYSTVSQSNLPQYAQPYFENLMNNAQNLATSNYQPYTGQQVAGLTPLQNQAISGVQAAQGNYQPYFNAANQSFQTAGSWQPTQISSNYSPSTLSTQSFTSPGTAAQYMNPYLQQALAPQIELQNTQFARQGQALNSTAAANGAFGGYRNALEQSQNTLNNNLANQNLIGNAYNQAFNTAQGQFNTEQQMGLQAGQLNQANQQQAAGLGLQAGTANNQFGLGAAQLGLAAGQAQQGLGQAQQQAALNDTQALMQAGTAQQNQQQNELNTAYQNYLNQTYFPYQQLNWLSGILHGVPVQGNLNVTGYAPTPSPVSQIAGLGLGAAGLAKAMG